MHASLIAVATFAFLPFTIIAAGLVFAGILMILTLIAAIVAGGGDIGGGEVAEPFANAGVRSIPPYYRWLARQRHPVFWGIPVGVLFGGLLLWGFVATIVVPGEARTVETLAEVQAEIEQIYDAEKRYPQPTAGNHLTHAALNRPDLPGIVTDGFNRPIEYKVDGRWRIASYRLRSLGYDGAHGTDDLCMFGSTRLARLSSLIKRDAKAGRLSIVIKLGAIKDLSCDE